MKRDYSSRYSGFRRKSAQGSGSRGGEAQLNKIGGILLTAVMLVGIAISVWFGWAVRSGLAQLDQENRTRQELLVRHEKLLGERQALMKEERIEAVAATLGLFPARHGQMQRP
ncbi:MAG TPA: cell division protein FtsL [Desulfurivibrionaceae bacterium]|nr:cell division protein FtsL [Desulfurivibrionaceae bacterium]